LCMSIPGKRRGDDRHQVIALKALMTTPEASSL
jgi:hypothetical protein